MQGRGHEVVSARAFEGRLPASAGGGDLLSSRLWLHCILNCSKPRGILPTVARTCCFSIHVAGISHTALNLDAVRAIPKTSDPDRKMRKTNPKPGNRQNPKRRACLPLHLHPGLIVLAQLVCCVVVRCCHLLFHRQQHLPGQLVGLCQGLEPTAAAAAANAVSLGRGERLASYSG